jgi:hypothetical protein
MAEQRSRRPRARTPAADPAEAGAGAEAAEPAASHAAACPVAFCPVGLAMTLTDQVRPEVVEHLMAAGRELLLAMKAVIDARVEGFERSSPLEKITIE